MAKLVKFPLVLADGTKARTIEELREHADIASVVQFFEDGKLQRWLLTNYLDESYEKILSIQEDAKKAQKEANIKKLTALCSALELTGIDEQKINEYVEEKLKGTVAEVQSCPEEVQIEDDAFVKSELAKIDVKKVLNLDEINICKRNEDEKNIEIIIEDKRGCPKRNGQP